MRLKSVYTIVFIGLGLLLAACGGSESSTPPTTPPTPPGNPSTTPPTTPPPGSLSFSGTVTVPTGGTVAGTLVLACYLEGEDCSDDESKTKSVEVSSSGSFTMSVTSGTYNLFAFKDVDGDEALGDGDYLGAVLEGNNLAELTPPQSNLQITLSLIEEEPEQGETLAGTVALVSGAGDVSDSVVVACFLTNNQCDGESPNTQVLSITASGPQATFNFEEVVPGDYGVFAFKDLDGDETIGVGDLYGCYSSNGTDCLAVTPPKTDMSLEMAEVTSSNLQRLPLQKLFSQNKRTELNKRLEAWLKH